MSTPGSPSNPAEAAFAALGPDAAAAPRVDFLASLAASESTLRRAPKGALVVARLAPALGAQGEAYTPDPQPLALASFRAGAPELSVVDVSLATDAPPPVARAATAKALRLETASRPCCDAGSCTARKPYATLTLEVDWATGRGAFVVAEALASGDGETDAMTALAGAMEALERALGLGDASDAGAPEAGALEAPADFGPGAASEFARYTARWEGDRWVVRDHATPGPRAKAKRRLVTGLVIMLAGALLGAAAFGFRAQFTLALGLGIAGVVLVITGYAFVAVARFAFAYAAPSGPLVAIGESRVMVAPWVSRTGAVDLKLEGRLGAGIPLAEVHGARVAPRGSSFAVELDTDHGPLDAMSGLGRGVADAWCARILAVVEAARHGGSKPTVAQRIRARAQK